MLIYWSDSYLYGMKTVKSDLKKRVILVTWKNTPDSGIPEVYSSLKNFCDSYPQYSYNTLNNYLSKHKKPFENTSIKVERLPLVNRPKPHPDKPLVDKTWFWEFKYEEIDWEKSYRTIIKRILERGTKAEWEEMVRFYTKAKVIHTIKEEISYLPDVIIEEVCPFFKLKKKQLRCYTRKQSLPGHWI